jgi:hypothetical protein|tara:strand:+ start:1472 stop:1921 length:450 start_codon:yes stop_codon:yes gene_type:complete
MVERYRSGSEKTTAGYLRDLKVKYEFEPHYIPYMWIESKRYLPDFVLSSGIVLEVKGRFTLEDRKKHLFLRKSNPDLDVRFVFDRPASKLYKRSKTTYADWCNKHNFLYCKLSDGLPDSWLDEQQRKPSSRNRKVSRKSKGTPTTTTIS